MNTKLNIEFIEAYQIASTTNIKLAPDIMLRLYANYKQATKGNNYKDPTYTKEEDLRNAFKLNAWFQLNHLSEDEAKKEYINLVNTHLK